MYNRKDAFYKKAKLEGFKSRAAYKLIELNKKHALFRSGDAVLDVGCAPGGWIQVVLQQKKCTVVGVDLLEVLNLTDTRFTFIQGDITEQETVDKVLDACDGYDCVISDAAPNTSGSKLLDHVNSVDLVRLIFYFAKTVLKKGGNFACKVFEGEDRDALVKEIKKDFDFCKMLRPEATRKNSFEMYIVFKGFKGNNEQ
ncbi:ribosomal RNA methyltransferase RrmJ/FtsJ [Denitrovibrio acetiphilus DSM 12809]|uniref:Ribosomal RNA large subunit methyltransferase E n=1 Tax=Denitrovibrio acetiphilus (strain DSM 12809 / NBRC 114555 / N2460) TaxID=522772 RepID=D4H3N3_DENA2|nr:RlmE family RNA methyltransferase [Denitrovibrio acetiphilus]ADD69135.1 ribosomal RNA methyltransferase RrmJ/FtsJ [Denitrovibrio acetiphilus DSM 12809]